MKRIIEDIHSDPQQLLDLAVRIGHEAADITLKVYVHRSLIEIRLMNCLKSIIMIFRSKYESDTQAILKVFY